MLDWMPSLHLQEINTTLTFNDTEAVKTMYFWKHLFCLPWLWPCLRSIWLCCFLVRLLRFPHQGMTHPGPQARCSASLYLIYQMSVIPTWSSEVAFINHFSNFCIRSAELTTTVGTYARPLPKTSHLKSTALAANNLTSKRSHSLLFLVLL